ncbi:MAG: nucleotide exchange factor GrpE [Candidatus Yanofskybacteria bacterium]|nr:nucleotide exchange factor GrpE [Candidatus Yanofskybacteria bacterium]
MTEEQNQNITNNSEELDKCQQECEKYLNNWKRERADFLNYKKDEAKRMEEFIRFANEDLLMEIIETLDDLEKARQNFVKQNLGGQAAQDGLDQVLKKFQDLLGKYGTERIKVKGEKFDPALHEAVTAEAQNESGNTEIREEKLEEVRAGYTMHGKVIRPARVKIIK